MQNYSLWLHYILFYYHWHPHNKQQALFPCIRFCSVMEQIQHEDFYDAMQRKNKKFGTKEYYEKKWATLRRYSQERFYLYDLALKLTAISQIRGIRMIMENPWHPTNLQITFGLCGQA